MQNIPSQTQYFLNQFVSGIVLFLAGLCLLLITLFVGHPGLKPGAEWQGYFLEIIGYLAEKIGLIPGGDWDIKRLLMALLGILIIILAFLWMRPNFLKRIKGWKWFKYLLEFSFWMMVLLVGIELILRLTVVKFPIMGSENEWGWIPIANTRVIWKIEGSGITEFDEHGITKTPYQGGDTTVVVLGDSVTAAWQVDDDQNFVSVAEVELRDRGKLVDLINLGKGGYSIADYIFLAPLVEKYFSPDLVVIEITPQDFKDGFNTAHENYFKYNEFGELEVHLKDIPTSRNAVSGLQPRIANLSILRYFTRRIDDIKRNSKSLLNSTEENIGDNGSESDETQSDVAQDIIGQDNTTQDVQAAANSQATAELFELAQAQLSLLKEAYLETDVLILLVPQSPQIIKDNILFPDPTYEQAFASIEDMGYFSVINAKPEFDSLTHQGYMPRGFWNSKPGQGHLNIYGHQVIGELLAEKIMEVIN
jgi:lysophospholipase L1-like esterase